MKCSKCHSDNPSDSMFCEECGAQLISAEKMPVHTKTLQTPIRGTIKDVNVGDIIDDKYKLVEELGSGGMGVVYKAEQIEPVKRAVALKVIKLGMDTEEVVARFDTEKQALAVMKHPNIAKVHDAGATKSGRPYFVMEIVPGIPINDYCDKYKLTPRERLELFIAVCEAVQHAHQKGVIHRDLKPSNVLVEIQEDKPIPKIIDFGIAKATEHRLTERTIFTEQGQLIGTPEYMSPEQAEMSGLDIDTRTDIYSLGVMLYELLVGVLPFDSKTLRKAGFSEIQRIIRETDPPKASTRLSGLGDTQTSIAQQRGTDVASLQKQLKGDLDWITMKSMEKDRTRRYSTASDLAADITRHLKKEPIVARPPSKIYNIGRFIRRNKLGVTAAAFVILAVLIGVTAASIGFVRATKAEKFAKQEAKRANQEAQTAIQVSNFLVQLFRVSDPSEARGNSITAREILDRGANDVKEAMKNEPEVQSKMMAVIGEVYTNLGLYEEAEPLLLHAVEAQRRELGKEHPDTLNSIHRLANLYWYLYVFKGADPNHLKMAEPLYIEVVEARKRLLGEEHPNTLKANFDLASLYGLYDRWDEAEQLTRRTLEIQRRVLGNEHEDTTASMHNLGDLYSEKGRYKEALVLLQEAAEIRLRILGEDHPETMFTLLQLGDVYEGLGNSVEAERLYTKTLELHRKVFGDEHPDTIWTMLDVADFYQKHERYDEAEKLFREVLIIRRKILGNEHNQIQIVLKRLLALYEDWNKPEKATEYRALLKENEI